MLSFLLIAGILALISCRMADLPAATDLSTAGVLVSGALPTAGAASQTFANTGKELLLVRNGSGGSINVTIVSQAVVNDGEQDLPVGDVVVAVAAGATKVIGPFKPSVYNDDADKVTATLSDVTTVTVQVVKAGTFRAAE